MLTPDEVALIKLLTDLIIKASTTLRRVNTMTPEEVQAAIPVAEGATNDLMQKLKAH